MRIAFSLLALTMLSVSASAQTQVDARTQAIVASFNKSKHVVKSRHGRTMEKYKRVESKAAPRKDAASYSGRYAVDGLNYSLDLQVEHDGQVRGSGEEPLATSENIGTRFSISGSIAGALMTATKIYADGRREKLEGVFIESTSYESPTDKGTTMFGLGVITGLRDIGGVTTDRLFYQRR